MLNPDALCGRRSSTFSGKPLHAHDSDSDSGEDTNLWSALPDLDVSSNSVGHHHSVDGTDCQKKLREKMIIQANSQVALFNDKAEDFIAWRDDAIMPFKQAGRTWKDGSAIA
jgi:hypothetical protein